MSEDPQAVCRCRIRKALVEWLELCEYHRGVYGVARVRIGCKRGQDVLEARNQSKETDDR
jgi:hypothetical protein